MISAYHYLNNMPEERYRQFCMDFRERLSRLFNAEKAFDKVISDYQVGDIQAVSQPRLNRPGNPVISS